MARYKGDILIAIIIFFALIAVINNYIELPDITEELETTTVEAWAPGGMEEFKPGDGDEIISETYAETEAASESPVITYELTEAERDLVERVVMGAAGCESIKGQKAVAQCILNACRITGERPGYVVEAFRYTTERPTPSDEVKQSVSAVFDNGETIFGEEVLYFYNPLSTTSSWHETQKYVCTIGNHKFFSERKNDG